MGVDVDARTALVVGGGIGGLASAIALRRAGWEVQVLARSEQLREVGAGISLWPLVVAADGIRSRIRVALVGDAAHAMTSDLGQGGCTSLEDAVELGRQLDDRPADPAPGLARYVRLRRPRTQAIARRSAI